jgi:hypothetical protein
MLAGGGLRLLLLLLRLRVGVDGWDGLWGEGRWLQAGPGVRGRLQLRAQASCASSAAEVLVMGS